MRTIGVDLGGHTVTAGVVDFSGDTPTVLSAVTRQTPKSRDLLSVVKAVEELLLLAAPPGERCFVGIGIPGFVNRKRTKILKLTNFSGCDGAPLCEIISSNLAARGVNVSVKLENDANCAALGERAAGAARKMRNFVVLTLGTGIGAGIVAEGALLVGSRGMAGECGHIVAGDAAEICRCGGARHIETIASADWQERRAAKEGLPADFKKLWELRAQNAKARAITDSAIDALSRCINDIAVTLDPEAVILNGGMSKAKGLDAEIRKRVKEYLPQPLKSRLKIKISRLGDAASVIGAASLYTMSV